MEVFAANLGTLTMAMNVAMATVITANGVSDVGVKKKGLRSLPQ